MSCCSKCVPEFKFALTEAAGGDSKFLPSKANETDTGWDVRCAEKNLIIEPFEYVKIKLGIRMFAPDGWWLELRPRSSSHAKKNLNCLYGVIDNGYENELLLSAQYLPPINSERQTFPAYLEYYAPALPLEINFGEAIAQVIPVKRREMKVVEVATEQFQELCQQRAGSRGLGGFGSSGG